MGKIKSIAKLQAWDWISNFIPHLLGMWLLTHALIKVNPYWMGLHVSTRSRPLFTERFKTSYRQIPRSLGAASLDVIMTVSLQHFNGISAAQISEQLEKSRPNAFHIIAPLWGESTCNRWFTSQRASNLELWWGDHLMNNLTRCCIHFVWISNKLYSTNIC